MNILDVKNLYAPAVLFLLITIGFVLYSLVFLIRSPNTFCYNIIDMQNPRLNNKPRECRTSEILIYYLILFYTAYICVYVIQVLSRTGYSILAWTLFYLIPIVLYLFSLFK